MAEAQKQILEEIRDIIGGNSANDDEVLDLSAFAEDKKENSNKAVSMEKSTDVLSEIDALLAEESSAIMPPEGHDITRDDVEIELTTNTKPRTSVKADIEPDIAPEDFSGEINMSNSTEQLVSDESAEAAQAALKRLVQSAEEAHRPKVQSAPFRNGDTVEDLVMDMLKPILKDWMDANLPKLVQTIVEKEIKRLIPKE